MIGQLIFGALATKAKGAMAQSLVSGVGTLIDNKMASRSAKRKQANFYVNMRNAAQRAGFDPLTVLRSGTAGAYADAGYAPALSSNAFTNLYNDMKDMDVRHRESAARMDDMKQSQQIRRAELELNKAGQIWSQAVDKEYLDMAKDKHEHEVQNTMASTTLMTYQQDQIANEMDMMNLKYVRNADGSVKINPANGMPYTWAPKANEVHQITSMIQDPTTGRVFPYLNEEAFGPDLAQMPPFAVGATGSDYLTNGVNLRQRNVINPGARGSMWVAGKVLSWMQ